MLETGFLPPSLPASRGRVDSTTRLKTTEECASAPLLLPLLQALSGELMTPYFMWSLNSNSAITARLTQWSPEWGVCKTVHRDVGRKDFFVILINKIINRIK